VPELPSIDLSVPTVKPPKGDSGGKDGGGGGKKAPTAGAYEVPKGIQKKIERGESVPPGIQKKIDEALNEGTLEVVPPPLPKKPDKKLKDPISAILGAGG
jgi:hypothetical protein